MTNLRKNNLMLLLTLFAILLSSCKQEVSQEKKAEFMKQVANLVEIPAKKFGTSRSSVKAVLGAPLEIRTEEISNIHYPSQKDQIHTLIYKGLDVLIYDAVKYKKEMLFCVRMTANQPGILPALIGQDDKSIKSTFGEPTRIKEKIFEYDIGEELPPFVVPLAIRDFDRSLTTPAA